jgi:hypothetical protein
MSALHRALHIDRVVIVTPSVYGTDNSATLFGMKARGASARAIAVIDEKTPDSHLDAMGMAGMRGIRLNLVIAGEFNSVVACRRLLRAAGRIKSRHWHVQIYTTLAVISGIKGCCSGFADARGIRERGALAWQPRRRPKGFGQRFAASVSRLTSTSER